MSEGFSGRAAVIGAGSSGIAAAKVLLREFGIPVDVYERTDAIGGNWVFRNRGSSVYQSCYINTSKQLMAYSDFPMPEEYPDYPHHTHIAEYFERYVDHFDLRKHIRFRTEVKEVRPAPGQPGQWEVEAEPGGVERYQAVLVANGHHWDPKWPSFPGDFDGEVIHSHQYKVKDPFVGRRVLVVGIGNSGVDIASELSWECPDVAVAVRRGVWIFPKYIMGMPLDHFGLSPWFIFLPDALNRLMGHAVARLAHGDPRRFGLPRPKAGIFGTHPTISSEFLQRVGHGAIRIKPNIKELAGSEVLFEDGSREPFDAIIYATGYKISFPFLSDRLLPVEDNQVTLYRFVVPPRLPGLFFIGLVQPLGAVMPIAEMQSQWVGRILTGASTLPSPGEMEREIRKRWKAMRRRYVNSSRHTIQVDHLEYMRTLYREMVPPGWKGKLMKPFRVLDPFTREVFRRVRG